MPEILTGKILTSTSENEYKLNKINIAAGELIAELPYSSIYKINADGCELAYKIIRQNENLDFNVVLQSYDGLKHFSDIPSLVKVYDYRLAEDGSKFEVLMEYLDGYVEVGIDDPRKKYQHALRIFEIINTCLERGILPLDAGIANFMTDGEDVKMIDLDNVLRWNDIPYESTPWFINRLEEIRNWCPQISPEINYLINRFTEDRRKYLIPFNPMAEKLLAVGESFLSEKNDINSAINFFKAALKFNPYSAAAYNNLAVAYWSLDNIEKTVECLQAANEIEPGNEVYINNIADILISKNNRAEAQNILRGLGAYINDITTVGKRVAADNSVKVNAQKLQEEIDKYAYPSNYAYNINTLEPKGALVTRVDYITNYAPELFEPCINFLSVGSSLGYMMLYHSLTSVKCTGIEPDVRANEIVKKAAEYRMTDNIVLHTGTFKDFPKEELYDLIWMGNVFQYMYVDFEWEVARELAKISSGRMVIEAPLEGSYLQTQTQYNATWKDDRLMNNYSMARFKQEMGKYFDILSVNPSGTDPENRVLVVLQRNTVRV